MIPTFPIEELTVEEADEMIERGVVFDVFSKVALSSGDQGNSVGDFVRSDREQ